MTAYYNEIDPYAAQWLRNLIDAGHIARGDVDERSIADIRADELRGYTQAHFFAGIGGWSIALRLAGWPDDRPVWTGSCPCQPFSAAGAGKAADDERHLWPAWFSLIRECAPPVVYGEQVEAAIGWGWLDAVYADLEAEGYACGAAVLPACSVGAPHIRNRLWFVANTRHNEPPGWLQSASSNNRGSAAGILAGREFTPRSSVSRMADPDGWDAGAEGLQRGGQHGQRAKDSRASGLADADSLERGSDGGQSYTGADGRRHHRRDREVGSVANAERDAGRADESGRGPQRRVVSGRFGAVAGFWHDADWIACTDGKARPVGPGSFPLGHGIRNRASKLRAYGNAIVPQVAAEFIAASAALTEG